MTREEAIDLLDNLIGMVEDNHNSDYDTALQMGIKALEQESILDEIRSEIETLKDKQHCTYTAGLKLALEVIDSHISKINIDKV